MLKSLWFIGDTFLNEVFHALPGIKTEAVTSKKKIPYIYEYYNVTYFVTNPLGPPRNVLPRFTNALISGLNDAVEIPRFVVLVPNGDIAAYVKNKSLVFHYYQNSSSIG